MTQGNGPCDPPSFIGVESEVQKVRKKEEKEEGQRERKT